MRNLIRQGLARLGFHNEQSAMPSELEKLARLGSIHGVIAGGGNAPELGMHPVDWTDDVAEPLRSIVQLKGDGIRGHYIDGRLVTREGVPLECADHCLLGLKRLERWLGEPMFFDGEYIEEDGYNATLAAFRRNEGEGVFWLFDAVPMSQWRDDRCTQPIEARLERLAKALPHAESMFVGMFDYWIMGPGEARRKAEELWALGYEGIVAKRARSIYTRRRSDAWLRLKRKITLDGVVMDLTKGAAHAICRMPDGSTIKAAVKGDDVRMQIESGCVVEMRLHPVTGGGYRGATVMRVRHDREAVS